MKDIIWRKIERFQSQLSSVFQFKSGRDWAGTGCGVIFAAHPYPPGTSFHPESHIYVSFYELDCVEQS